MANQTVSATSIQPRFDKLRDATRQAGYDVTALVPGPTLRYLTGVSYHVMERPIILFFPVNAEPAMIVPYMELDKMKEADPFPIRFFPYSDAEGYLGAFEQACKALDLAAKRIAVEGLKMRVLEGQLIERYGQGCTVVSADDAITGIRLHKATDEVTAMRKAIAISEKALDATLPHIHIGMTEQQIMNILLNELTMLGGGGNAFDPIVLTGPNSALPHGVHGSRAIAAGDLLLFDYGTLVDGYPSDITRVFAVGEISQLDPEFRKIYDTVLAANEAGIRAARPGVTAQDVDRAARDVIEAAGYGKYFTHRLGHGLGLDIHEGPNVVQGNKQILEPGMVFTIEPGIYLPGRGGVRIEDDVVVTDSGIEVLTSYPKTLRSVGAK
ncbi:MAG TPA: Xaa-Pro peptidase family protein [Aggregatilineales bacterium]|nr:Xaa-Pro peptidase family protein [Aggregatilineales bacterium]